MLGSQRDGSQGVGISSNSSQHSWDGRRGRSRQVAPSHSMQDGYRSRPADRVEVVHVPLPLAATAARTTRRSESGRGWGSPSLCKERSCVERA